MLFQCLRYEADSERGLFGLVQKFHLPFSVLFETAGNAANEIAANSGHLCPSGVLVGEIKAAIRSAGEFAVADPERIKRHGATVSV